jgi:hypothetical protein
MNRESFKEVFHAGIVTEDEAGQMTLGQLETLIARFKCEQRIVEGNLRYLELAHLSLTYHMTK